MGISSPQTYRPPEGVGKTLSSYLDYMIFNYFHSGKYHEDVSEGQLVKEGLSQDFYGHVFFAPKETMSKRSAMLKKMPHPFVGLWRKEPWTVPADKYGISSLKQNFIWHDDPKHPNEDRIEHTGRGRLIWLQTKYSIIAESYFLDFINRFSTDLTELDFLRYPPFIMKGYMDDYFCRPEFKIASSQLGGETDDEKGARAFQLDAELQLLIQVPEIREFHFVEKVNFWLENRKVYTVVGYGGTRDDDDVPPASDSQEIVEAVAGQSEPLVDTEEDEPTEQLNA